MQMFLMSKDCHLCPTEISNAIIFLLLPGHAEILVPAGCNNLFVCHFVKKKIIKWVQGKRKFLWQLRSIEKSLVNNKKKGLLFI